jgi:hypothetical protein
MRWQERQVSDGSASKGVASLMNASVDSRVAHRTPAAEAECNGSTAKAEKLLRLFGPHSRPFPERFRDVVFRRVSAFMLLTSKVIVRIAASCLPTSNCAMTLE